MNDRLLALMNPDEVEVVIRLAEEAEVDEQWSFVGKKKAQRWLWHAIDHRSGTVLAYVFGRLKDEVFLEAQGVAGALWDYTILHGLWGRMHASSGR